MQKKLLHFTKYEFKLAKAEIPEERYQKIRGITAVWNELEETSYFTFYYDGEIQDEDAEIASELCAYVAAHLTRGIFKEVLMRLDYPQELRSSDFWAYNKL